MLGSSILDIAIGLVFVYLLLSLMVTATSEMIAGWFKRRHDNLWQGMVNLLGPACASRLYAHPLIQGLSPPPLLRWADAKGWKQVLQWLLGLATVEANGPSYIPSRTFAVCLLDIVGFKPGSGLESNIRRLLDGFPDSTFDARTLKNALLAAANSSLAGSADIVREFQGFLLTIPDTAAFSTATGQLQQLLGTNPAKYGNLSNVVSSLVSSHSGPTLSARDVKAALLQLLGSPPVGTDLASFLDCLPDSASPTLVKQEVLRFLDKQPVADLLSYLPQELQNSDLGKSLQLLWDEADHDLEKFKMHIETWFNDAMDRVSGWYKRESQLVNLVLAVVLTLMLNVDTVLLVNTLAKNSALRDSLVAQATKFAEQPPVHLQATRAGTAETTATATADAALSSTNDPYSIVLSPNPIVAGEDLKGIVTLRETNSSDLVFNLLSSATNLVGVGASLTIPRGQKSAEFPIKTRPIANSTQVDISVSNRVVGLQLTPNPREQFRAARAELENLNLPIGWVLGTSSLDGTTLAPGGSPSSAFADRSHELFLTLVSPLRPLFWSTIAFHWLGWLLTAIAVSLGAPFWFDLLNKFITIRSSGKAPEEKPKPPKEMPQPSGTAR